MNGGRVGEVVLHVGGNAVASEGVLRHVHPVYPFLIVGGLYSVTAWRENDQERVTVYTILVGLIW